MRFFGRQKKESAVQLDARHLAYLWQTDPNSLVEAFIENMPYECHEAEMKSFIRNYYDGKEAASPPEMVVRVWLSTGFHRGYFDR